MLAWTIDLKRVCDDDDDDDDDADDNDDDDDDNNKSFLSCSLGPRSVSFRPSN